MTIEAEIALIKEQIEILAAAGKDTSNAEAELDALYNKLWD